MNIKNSGHSIFAYDNWEIGETEVPKRDLQFHETIFSQGNGYFGFRGTFEEPYDVEGDGGREGNYINGFYETVDISYGEAAYAFPKQGQTMLNVVNAKGVRITVGDETFDMRSGRVADYKRSLSFREGTLKRELTWISPKGQRVGLRFERLISFKHRNIAVIRCAVRPYGAGANIRISALLDAGVRNEVVSDDPRVGTSLTDDPMVTLSQEAKPDFSCIIRKTKRSGLSLCCAMACVPSPGSRLVSATAEHNIVRADYSFEAAPGQETVFDKFICYTDSREFADSGLADAAREKLNEAIHEGFDALKAGQAEYLNRYWRASDVEIKGNTALQQGLHYNIFQLLQSAGKDGRTNIGSKGLSGEGYEGHYFWDTETYILPFFTYTLPEISKKLLEYRYSILDRARARAREMDHKIGALYAWRTINGDECSAYFPAGTAQYHINADIAHAIRKYWEATGDTAFLCDGGAEILFETARLWQDLGHFNPNRDGKFCINCVTGPDEYHAIVNNNCYTNMMARENLRFALTVAELLKRDFPGVYASVAAKIGLHEEELASWKEAADNMYIPYDEKSGIHLQDDSFLDRKPWELDSIPAENHPLLMYYHPLVIYRHNLCKQADVVLALFMLGGNFTKEEKKRDFDYYEKITTHDSSLSTSIFCIMACELGYRKKALDYFMSTARLDLDDINNNTKDGIHTANMAGTWMCMVNGFAGMRAEGKNLSFKPVLPDGWDGYSFRITFMGKLLRVTVDRSGVEYALLEGNGLTLRHGDESIVLNGAGSARHMDFTGEDV